MPMNLTVPKIEVINDKPVQTIAPNGTAGRVGVIADLGDMGVNTEATVIGAPGDTIDISDSNRPIVNGNTLVEDMIFYDTPKRDERVNYPITLGEDEYFILVDNRKEGLDSRYFGPVKKKEILGTIINIIRRNKL